MSQSSFTTPVVLMIFKRPHTTQQVFQVIRQLQPRHLFVIADGPNPEHPEEIEKCATTRAIIDQVDWECEVDKNYSDINLGCKQRVSTGLNWVFSKVEEAIILEDDCVPNLSFFRFCQELLERYRYHEQVFQITGENTHGYQVLNASYYFSAYNFYWGWATWKRAWQYFDGSLKQWPQIRESGWLQNYLRDNSAVEYWTEIFDLTYNGFNSWGWAWTFTCFLHQGLCVVPNANLITNVGFGRDAAHTTWEVDEIANLPTRSIDFPIKHPTNITNNFEAESVINKMRFTGRKYLRGMQQKAVDLFNQGKDETALQIWEDCIAFRPDLKEFYYEKARCLNNLGKHQQAIQGLNELLKVYPKYEQAKLLLNEIQQNLNNSSGISHQLLNKNVQKHKKIEQKENLDRYLVYTMGKVASTSISTSLKTYTTQVYDIHFLDKNYLDKNMHKGHCVDSYFVLKNWMGQPLKIISMVRNPIEVNIGGFFQNIEIYYPNLTREQIRKLTVEELIQKFWTLDQNYPLLWFDREFNKSLNFDIYTQPFSILGWKTYLHHPYHILIMQAELMDQQKEEVLREFTGFKNFQLENHNISSQKWYSHVFKEFKERIVLPQDYLNTMLNSKMTQHFYSFSQIEKIYKYWNRRGS